MDFLIKHCYTWEQTCFSEWNDICTRSVHWNRKHCSREANAASHRGLKCLPSLADTNTQTRALEGTRRITLWAVCLQMDRAPRPHCCPSTWHNKPRTLTWRLPAVAPSPLPAEERCVCCVSVFWCVPVCVCTSQCQLVMLSALKYQVSDFYEHLRT